ncbi:hypothetical protein QYF36_013554 [Acer negundo]|nr:hypothetical protein QYF36_013554 [Acer negundo]
MPLKETGLRVSSTPLILPTHAPSGSRQTDQDPADSPIPSSFQDVGVDAGSKPQLPIQIPLSPPAPRMLLGPYLPISTPIVSTPSRSTPSISTPPVSAPPSSPPTLIPPRPTLSTMLAHAARARGSPV